MQITYCACFRGERFPFVIHKRLIKFLEVLEEKKKNKQVFSFYSIVCIYIMFSLISNVQFVY